MKKLLIYLGIVVLLFGGLYFVNQQSTKSSDKANAGNPYGVAASKLNPETVKQLTDPNYQNLILPKDLGCKIEEQRNIFPILLRFDLPALQSHDARSCSDGERTRS